MKFREISDKLNRHLRFRYLTAEHFNNANGDDVNDVVKLMDTSPFKVDLKYLRYTAQDKVSRKSLEYRWVRNRNNNFLLKESEDEFVKQFAEFKKTSLLERIHGAPDGVFEVYFDNLVLSEFEEWEQKYLYLFRIWRYIVQPFSYLFFGSTFCGSWSPEFYNFGKLVEACFGSPSHDLVTINNIYFQIVNQLKFKRRGSGSWKNNFPFMSKVSEKFKDRENEAQIINKGHSPAKFSKTLKNIYYRQDPNLINAMLARKIAKVAATRQEILVQMQIKSRNMEKYCEQPKYLPNSTISTVSPIPNVLYTHPSVTLPYYFPQTNNFNRTTENKLNATIQNMEMLHNLVQFMTKIYTYTWILSHLLYSIKFDFTDVLVSSDQELNMQMKNFYKTDDDLIPYQHLTAVDKFQKNLGPSYAIHDGLRLSIINKMKQYIDTNTPTYNTDIGSFLSNEILRFNKHQTMFDIHVGFSFFDDMLQFNPYMWSMRKTIKFHKHKQNSTNLKQSRDAAVQAFLSNVSTVLNDFQTNEKWSFIKTCIEFILDKKQTLTQKVLLIDEFDNIDTKMKTNLVNSKSTFDDLCTKILILFKEKRGYLFYEQQNTMATNITSTHSCSSSIGKFLDVVRHIQYEQPPNDEAGIEDIHPLFTKWMYVDSTMKNPMSIFNESILINEPLFDGNEHIQYPYTFTQPHFGSTVSIDYVTQLTQSKKLPDNNTTFHSHIIDLINNKLWMVNDHEYFSDQLTLVQILQIQIGDISKLNTAVEILLENEHISSKNQEILDSIEVCKFFGKKFDDYIDIIESKLQLDTNLSLFRDKAFV